MFTFLYSYWMSWLARSRDLREPGPVLAEVNGSGRQNAARADLQFIMKPVIAPYPNA